MKIIPIPNFVLNSTHQNVRITTIYLADFKFQNFSLRLKDKSGVGIIVDYSRDNTVVNGV